eukprot:Plantae.Rhodophyta-Purpureofilum_apyrenoidigerum.ctg41913.p1 GENE.Plantae.Rhodophyta-Purpureofilum_apyrenoidigerum.ctg41913~~Plantae.Rhodophyta-Purpureofilum_apyrenoidigerum.ctg41913.p1  ORF type:complete len:228 (+),score=42.94 Plantae.Rhodophyta-Purpureofilum_apyrenoidigerum.ctg41913:101-784(+)
MVAFVTAVVGGRRQQWVRCCETAKSEDGLVRRARANEVRREKMRALWQDPEWREKVLDRRRSETAVRKHAEAISDKWSDDEYKQRVRDSLKGRQAWNKGVPMKEQVRRKLSVMNKGVKKSAETRRKMSEAKLSVNLPAHWRENITKGKLGKTKEFFKLRREYEALQQDLKLWSDSHRVRTGRCPKASAIDSIGLHPPLLSKLKKYLGLKARLQEYDSVYEHDDPILR